MPLADTTTINRIDDLRQLLDKGVPASAQGKSLFAETFTPTLLIEEMLATLPPAVFADPTLRWLDPCAGIGNFQAVLIPRLMAGLAAVLPDPQLRLDHIVTHMLFMAELQAPSCTRLRQVFGTHAQLFEGDFLSTQFDRQFACSFDIVLGNPPYERMLAGKGPVKELLDRSLIGTERAGGLKSRELATHQTSNGPGCKIDLILHGPKRSAKNDNLWSKFIDKGMACLKPGGYLLFITPPAWMSPTSAQLRNVFGPNQMIHLNIQECARHFRVGSRFSYYLLRKTPRRPDDTTKVTCVFQESKSVRAFRTSMNIALGANVAFIPQLCTLQAMAILHKTVFDTERPKFAVCYDSDLHRFTKKHLLSTTREGQFQHRVLHTPRQTLWASRAHKHEGRVKVFIPLTTYYESILIDTCGNTQGIGYILCDSLEQASKIRAVLLSSVYRFIANITRWSNFNVPQVMRTLPQLDVSMVSEDEITDDFVAQMLGLDDAEVRFLASAVKPA